MVKCKRETKACLCRSHKTNIKQPFCIWVYGFNYVHATSVAY